MNQRRKDLQKAERAQLVADIKAVKEGKDPYFHWMYQSAENNEDGEESLRHVHGSMRTTKVYVNAKGKVVNIYARKGWVEMDEHNTDFFLKKLDEMQEKTKKRFKENPNADKVKGNDPVHVLSGKIDSLVTVMGQFVRAITAAIAPKEQAAELDAAVVSKEKKAK